VPCIILGPIGPIAIGSLFPGVKRSERQADSFHLMRTFIDVTLSLPLSIHISFLEFCMIVRRHNCAVHSALQHCCSFLSCKVRGHSGNAPLFGGLYR